MSQQIYQSEIATQKQTDLDQSSPEQAKPKDKSILQRLDFSTSTLNDHKDNSSHIDNLLCSSFIELDHFVEREQETSNLDTGQSFFKRNNHPFLSDFAQQDQKKISHKKVQCQIGKGYYLSQTQPSKNLINKFKTLQVLKMAKLLKLVLKQLKQGISSLSKEIKINDQQNRQKLYQLSLMFQEKVTSINLEMKYKNTKIADLQRENEMLNYQLSQLKQDLQYQMEENVCSLKNIEEYKQITTLEIDRLQNEKKQNIAELSQRLQKCEVSNSLLQDEINNLNETILEQETLNKKLQYQKKLLQNDYEEISQKSQEWLKKSLEHQITFSQDCIEFYRSDGELSQLIKLKHLYLQEIQKYKTEIQKVREENLLIKKHSDIYVAEQLYNLRDQYERKYKELQNESRKKGNQKQNNQNFVEVCKKNQSQGSNFKNKQKRSINTQTFRQSINSLKKTHSHQEYDSQVTNSLPPQKQNQKNSNLGGKKIAKNLLQQIKDPLPFQNHNTLSIKGSLDQIDISGEVVFRANQHVKGKLKLSNLLYSYKEASISVNMKSTETSPNSQNIQGKEVRKNFSNFMKN